MTKMRKFAVAYGNFKNILDDEDLNKNCLTLSDYQSVYNILVEMSDCRTTSETICKTVTEWFKRNNFNVTEKGIGWKISL